MEDLIRFLQPGIISFLGAAIVILALTLVISRFMKKSTDEDIRKAAKLVKWIGIGIVIVLTAIFVWQVLVALSINNVDRGIIDRSGIDFNRYGPSPTQKN